ncbi:MAG: translation elongation factor 4 [Patescibacteria group bacterium]|nr:translation elongation factor 4 [Patescibacteria group bacterium]
MSKANESATSYGPERIRNFSIIAHVDHGKSTLADRILELTGSVTRREMREQFLDSMDLERERGITIKLKAVRMNYNPTSLKLLGAPDYQLNMIDTPGHVDFGYEVSRSLAACEGAVLVVDATQGIEAQTVANVYKAMEQKLKIIAFINKTDLPAAQPEKVVRELEDAFSMKSEDIFLGSAKTGEGVEGLLGSILGKIPPPASMDNHNLRALIFDSVYDEHLGALAFVRVFDGELNIGDDLLFLSNNFRAACIELGVFSPKREKVDRLLVGEVGYVATGVKDLRKIKIGDTITKVSVLNSQFSIAPLPGYREPKPMVYLGFYPLNGGDFLKLRTALEKIYLTDSSITFEPESSKALGNGFRCGFLGFLHSDIIRERLEREYKMDLITTLPSVPYLLEKEAGEKILINSASNLPVIYGQQKISEPWLRVSIFVPGAYLGTVLNLCQEYRGVPFGTEYLGSSVKVTYQMPLSEMLYDFYDKLKSTTSGYASLDYEFLEFRPAEVCRLDILVAGEPVDPLSQIVVKEKAQKLGKAVTAKLKDLLPRQQFPVAIQAAVGGKIVAREDIPAMRKNVLAKMSGGHRERKDKLLEKQKRGKERLKRFGKIDIPKEVFTKLLKVS